MLPGELMPVGKIERRYVGLRRHLMLVRLRWRLQNSYTLNHSLRDRWLGETNQKIQMLGFSEQILLPYL